MVQWSKTYLECKDVGWMADLGTKVPHVVEQCIQRITITVAHNKDLHAAAEAAK